MQENFTNDDETEIDLVELLLELLKYRRQIILSTLLCGAIGAVISLFLITPMYESTSELFVLSKSTSITSLADIQMGSSLTNDYIVTVVDRPILEQVIHNLNLTEDYEQLKDKITLTNPDDSRILQITVQDEDPERAKQIADNIAEVASTFISVKMDQDPPSIISYGYSDGEKVSPSTSKNTLIGCAIGFVLAAAIVIIGFLIDDSVMTTEDVEKKLGLNVLGTLPFEEDETEYDGKSADTGKKRFAGKSKDKDSSKSKDSSASKDSSRQKDSSKSKEAVKDRDSLKDRNSSRNSDSSRNRDASRERTASRDRAASNDNSAKESVEK